MKKPTKSNKGITLITLVITVIVIAILASVATYSGIEVINSSKLTRFTTEMKLIQTKVNEIYEKKDDPETENFGKALTSQDIAKFEEIKDSIGTQDFTNRGYDGSQESAYEGYKLYEKSELEDIGIEQVDQKVFINIAKRKVINYDGIKTDDGTFYIIEQVPNNLYNVKYEEKNGIFKFKLEYEEIENNRFKVKITKLTDNSEIEKWKVKYKKNGENYWNTSETLTFILNEPGEYIFKVVNGNIQSNEISQTIGEKYSTTDYITNNLVLQYDAINNTGEGDENHSATTTIWKDLSGNNKDGTLTNFNGNYWGKNYLEFDGNDDGLNLGNNLQDIFKNSNTIEFVIEFSEAQARDVIMGNYNYSSHAISYEKVANQNNGYRVWFNYGNPDVTQASTEEGFYIKEKQTISYVYDKESNKIKLYLNGSNIGEINSTVFGSYNYDFNSAWIGRDSRTGATCLKGNIYAVRVYDKVLTDEELQNNYEVDESRFSGSNSIPILIAIKGNYAYMERNLILRYDAINNTGEGDDKHSNTTTIWKDLSGNNKDGTLTNFNGNYWEKNYLEFDGNDDGLNLGNNLQDIFKNSNTIEFVIEFSEAQARDIIMGNYNYARYNNYEKVANQNNGYRIVLNASNPDVTQASTEKGFYINKKQTISYVYDKENNKIKVYLNGNKIGEISNEVIGNYNYDFNNAWIGRDSRTGATCLKGNIYAVRVYNTVLTDEEILSNYQVDKVRFDLEN